MLRLEVSARARQDLAEIRDYSRSEFGHATGDTYLLGFDKHFERLMDFPELGVAVPDDTHGRRMFRYRSHFVFYRVDGQNLKIVRILHIARDAQQHLA